MNKRPPSSARVDERVYLTMGCLAIISLLILAFRYAAHRPCAPITLRVTSGSFIRGSLVNFTADTKGGSSYDWNFGDGTTTKGSDPSTGHNYAVAGRYTVSVTVNGECSELQSLVINEAKIIINNTLQPVISVVDTAFVNVPMTVEDLSPNSTSWAWTFEEGASVDQTSRKASHKYTTTGTKLIHLEVNGRSDLQMSRWIMVIDPNAAKTAAAAAPRPAAHNQVTVIQLPTRPSEQPLTVAPAPAAAKEPTKAPEISEGSMASMLQGVSENGKTAEDFSQYLCGNVGISVIYNGDKMTFAKMCDNIKAIKKGRIKSIVVQITKDQSNCILAMNVTLKTKWKLF